MCARVSLHGSLAETLTQLLHQHIMLLSSPAPDHVGMCSDTDNLMASCWPLPVTDHCAMCTQLHHLQVFGLGSSSLRLPRFPLGLWGHQQHVS
jgi:hypothetical protein